MKTIHNIVLATAAIFALTSCESDATVDIPETKPKLVVASFISPQDTQIVVPPVAQTESMAHSAVLLAGGKSSRMGRDKAHILVHGEPLWRRQLRVLSETGETLEIAGGGHASTTG